MPNLHPDSLQPIVITVVLFVITAILIRLFTKPLRLLGRLLVTAVSGIISLFLFNYISTYTAWGLLLPLNFLTVAISGFFGIPGVIVLVIWKMLV